MSDELTIEVWSDIACPWCYVGKRRLEAALARFPHHERVRLTWRAFELDPSAPPVRDLTVSHVERIAKKYGTSPERAQAMTDQLVQAAAGDGLAFDFEHIKSGNTLLAHRLIRLGRERGIQDQVEERFFRAYLSEGQAIGERDVLLKLAIEAGLDAEEARAVLESDRFTDEVREDQREAAQIGIRGVPFFVIGRRYAVSGAQPAELLLEALTKAWDEQRQEDFGESGAVCGPDGCA